MSPSELKVRVTVSPACKSEGTMVLASSVQTDLSLKTITFASRSYATIVPDVWSANADEEKTARVREVAVNRRS